MLEQALELADFQRDSDGKLRAGPGKFEGLRPFEVWIASNVLGDSSWWDESYGDMDYGEFVALCGKWILSEDDRGFAYAHKYATAELARDAYSVGAAEYWKWSADDPEDETSFSEEWHAAYRHARYVRDTDVNTAESFADFVDDRAELIDSAAAEFGESPYADAWSAFVRERTPRGSDGQQ